MMFLDFRKIFDKVPQRRLMFMVKHFEIGCNVQNMTKIWLSSTRNLNSVINGTTSNWVLVPLGFPNGSVFKPVLFLICINDSDVRQHHRTFTDDSLKMKKIKQIIVNKTNCVKIESDCIGSLNSLSNATMPREKTLMECSTFYREYSPA